MILILAIIIIVVLLCLDKEEKDKITAEENKIVGYNTTNGRPILKKYVNITGYDERTGQTIFEYKKPIIGYNTETGEPIFEGDKLPENNVPKQPLTEEEKNRLSNSILIVTGAILVVIASIIFLATGWETMHGFLKTLILVGIQAIFYGFGYVSNEKLNIPKIGKMFNYLTLAFVPIIISSLSFFELVGEYLSIGGEGFTYYIGFALLASDFIYKYYGKVKNEIFVKRSSLVLEALSIIFILNRVDIPYIEALAMVLHTIIIYILLQGGYLDKKAYAGIHEVYSIFLMFAIGIPTLSEVNIISFISLIILALGFFIKCLDCEDEDSKKSLLSYFLISYLLSIRIIEEFDIFTYFLYLLSLLPILGLIKVIDSKTTKNNIVTVVGILAMAITTFSVFNSERTIYFLLTYITGFIIFLIVYALSKGSLYKICMYISFSLIFFALFYITEVTGVSQYILLIMAILVYALEILFEKLKDESSIFFIMGCLIIETWVFTTEYTILLPLILMTIYLLLENKKKLLLIPMIGSFLILSLDNRTIVDLIFGVLTIIYIFASVSIEEFNKFSIFSLITIIILWIDLEISAYVLWTLILIWGVIHYICKPKDNNEIYISAMILSIFGLYTKTLIDIETELYANYALGVILLSICMTKGVLKKWDKDFLGILEWCVIGGLTLFGAIIIQEPIDGVAYLGILLVVSILSYSKEWKTYLYSSIISMIFGVIVLTAEYWKELPWYVYILVIGLALISFAMYDEKSKQMEKEEKNNSSENPEIPLPVETETSYPNNLEINNTTNNITEEITIKEEIPIIEETTTIVETPEVANKEMIVEELPIIEEQPVIEEIVQESKPSIKLQIVEDTSIDEKIKIENKNIKQTGAKKANRTTSVNKQKHKMPSNRR